jgi:hypothetical protein
VKIIGRILIILLAALVVVGATAALLNNGLADALNLGGEDGRPAGQFERDERPAGAPEGEFGERGGVGVGGFLSSLARNLGVIALIVTGVVSGQWLWSKLSVRRRDSGAASSIAEGPPEKEFL